MKPSSQLRALLLCPLLLLLVIFLPTPTDAKMKKSYQYGDIIMLNSKAENGGGAVTFRHWTHRDKYTCRLCHVDLEFSQLAGDTDILEEDNQSGRYCGACHDGKEAFSIKTCTRCHAKDADHLTRMNRQAKKEFYILQRSMPRSMYGNKIDWMQAEYDGIITLKDKLPKFPSPKRTFISNQRDEPLEPSLPGLPNIIFSHRKHVTWNGCGMCHPQPFELKNGATTVNMQLIIDGNLCGRCHGTVAFQINDCALCHSKPVSL